MLGMRLVKQQTNELLFLKFKAAKRLHREEQAQFLRSSPAGTDTTVFYSCTRGMELMTMCDKMYLASYSKLIPSIKCACQKAHSILGYSEEPISRNISI
jgi:hypothetical protein